MVKRRLDEKKKTEGVVDLRKGQIRKAISGFYYVYVDGQTFQTRGRGNFRVKNMSPLVGDYVDFESDNKTEGILIDIYPRKNELIRPTVANIDYGIIVMSAVEPDFSSYLVDRFLVYLEDKKIKPIIYVTKIDLLDEETTAEMNVFKSYYESIGYKMILSDYPASDASLNTLIRVIGNGTAVFMGQSGAGKSTLLNQLMPELELETGEISTALGRGRHTTRHVELHPIGDALIADTPGFSTIDLIDIEEVDLPSLFPDFVALRDECRFSGCMHINEPNCRIKAAVETGEIAKYRYDHYLQFYEEINTRKPMYVKKKK